MAVRRVPVVAAALPLAAVLTAQSAAAQPPARATTLTGVVYDSLARRPLAGAAVQFEPAEGAAGASFTAAADSLGRYRIAGVPAGRYVAGFFHPRVDSLGIGLAPVTVAVRGDVATVDLAFPSAASVQRQLCSPSEISDSTALLVGFVRDAVTREPRRGANVRLQWAEIVVGASSVRHERPQLVVQTRGDGWFGVCGVPTTGDGDIGAVAQSGADTSGVVPLRLGAAGVAWRDLYVGSAAAATVAGPADGRVRGVVRAARGRAVAGARVQLVGGGAVATTDSTGAFALADRVTGSQLLDVRAIGYLPAQVAVDLVATGEPSTVGVTLTRTQTYLDTVRVFGRQAFDGTGFERRRRSNPTGYFMGPEAIARRGAVLTTDLFNVAGVRLAFGQFGQRQVVMRAADNSLCTPVVFIDGMPLLSTVGATDPTAAALATLNDVDLYTTPRRLQAIEIYRDPTFVPAEFRRNAGQCGSIVLWTRERVKPAAGEARAAH